VKPLPPQTQVVLDHLRRHSHLTSWQAEGVYRIRRLASRVDELRATGFEIETQTCEDASGQRYTRYRLSRRQRRSKAPLLEARRAPKQYRVDALLQLYRNYCTDELGLDANDATEEVAAFTKFLLEKNA